jgi:hypothetical protein
MECGGASCLIQFPHPKHSLDHYYTSFPSIDDEPCVLVTIPGQGVSVIRVSDQRTLFSWSFPPDASFYAPAIATVVDDTVHVHVALNRHLTHVVWTWVAKQDTEVFPEKKELVLGHAVYALKCLKMDDAWLVIVNTSAHVALYNFVTGAIKWGAQEAVKLSWCSALESAQDGVYGGVMYGVRNKSEHVWRRVVVMHGEGKPQVKLSKLNVVTKNVQASSYSLVKERVHVVDGEYVWSVLNVAGEEGAAVNTFQVVGYQRNTVSMLNLMNGYMAILGRAVDGQEYVLSIWDIAYLTCQGRFTLFEGKESCTLELYQDGVLYVSGHSTGKNSLHAVPLTCAPVNLLTLMTNTVEASDLVAAMEAGAGAHLTTLPRNKQGFTKAISAAAQQEAELVSKLKQANPTEFDKLYLKVRTQHRHAAIERRDIIASKLGMRWNKKDKVFEVSVPHETKAAGTTGLSNKVDKRVNRLVAERATQDPLTAEERKELYAQARETVLEQVVQLKLDVGKHVIAPMIERELAELPDTTRPPTSLVAQVIALAFADIGNYPKRAVHSLLKDGLLLDSHVAGGLLPALVLRHDWQGIELALRHVPDVLERAKVDVFTQLLDGVDDMDAPDAAQVLVWIIESPHDDSRLLYAFSRLTFEHVAWILARLVEWTAGLAKVEGEFSWVTLDADNIPSVQAVCTLIRLLLDTHLITLLLDERMHAHSVALGEFVASQVQLSDGLERIDPFCGAFEVKSMPFAVGKDTKVVVDKTILVHERQGLQKKREVMEAVQSGDYQLTSVQF